MRTTQNPLTQTPTPSYRSKIMQPRTLPQMATIALLCTLAANTYGAVISVNHYASTKVADTLGSTDVAGVVAVDEWNNIGVDNDGAYGSSGLNLDDGTSSGASAELTTTDSFVQDDWNSGSPDRVMMGNGPNFRPADNPLLTVSGLSFAIYDIYVYVASNNGVRFAEAILNGGTPVEFAEPGSLFAGTFDNGDDGTGNYIKFANVTGASFTLVVQQDLDEPNFGRVTFNGFQIVEGVVVPAPAALPAGLALLGLFVLRRGRVTA